MGEKARSTRDISIHAPRTGSDRAFRNVPNARVIFQSTLPARGATKSRARNKAVAHHFNPRSPHGERPVSIWKPKTRKQFQSTLPARGATPGEHGESGLEGISIHAPRTGSDRYSFWLEKELEKFQSTLPARGATRFRTLYRNLLMISIHAPRTGSDRGLLYHIRPDVDFNPRSPHGERLACISL